MAFGAFANESSPEYKSFIGAALKTKVAVAHTFDASIASQHGLSIPGVAVFNQV